MFIRVHQSGFPIFLHTNNVDWIASNNRGSHKSRIKCGEDKLLVDESFEQLEALLTASGQQIYFIKDQESAAEPTSEDKSINTIQLEE